MANNTGLASQLVAPPGRLATPRGGVGFPHALPPQIQFGNLSPGITTNSRYSGGAVPGGSSSFGQQYTPPAFQAPTYAPRAAGAVPIVQALQASPASQGFRPPPPAQPPAPGPLAPAAGAPSTGGIVPIPNPATGPLPGAANPMAALSALLANLSQNKAIGARGIYRQ